MIEDQDYCDNREFEDLSNSEELLFSAIKDETCVMMNETLPELLDDTLNSDCDKFDIQGSCSGENESVFWQEKFQKMMLTGYKRSNCIK